MRSDERGSVRLRRRQWPERRRCPSVPASSHVALAADDEDDMDVLPPWKLSEREEWAEAHPWLAGFYFGLLMTPVYLVITGNAERLYLAAIGGLVSWPLFAVGMKHRWGYRWVYRPDAKRHPPPTYRREWSRSDAFLSWFMWLGIVSVVLTPLYLLAGTVRPVLGLAGLIAGLYLALTTWTERRRRRRSE